MSDQGESVDRAYLDKLGQRFGTAFVVQMIDLFIEQGQGRVAAARQALAASDVEGIASAAHALKSSAANLGAVSLSTRAAEVERSGRTGASAADLASGVGLLEDGFAEASARLQALRDELASSR